MSYRERVYVWELPVRLAHWVIAVSFVVLGVTGVYIGHPFIIGGRFVMGWMRAIHFYFAIAFTLAVVARLAWMFQGNKYARWDQFLPVHRNRLRGLLPTMRFYVSNFRKPPGYVGHNPLAGLDYTVIFLLHFALIATGFAMYAASAAYGSPMQLFGFLAPLFGGLQTARLIHHVAMWLVAGFAVHHIYSSIVMSTVEANATIESIFSGYKFVKR